ncbi:MAG: ester cyclase [Anaerolineales bacterium]
MMSKLSSLEVTSKYVTALAAGDTDQMNALRTPDFELDFVYGDASASGPLSSEETKQFWPSWLVGFPEMDYEVTRTIAAEEVVVMQWVFTGTHSEPLGPPIFEPPVPPSGRTIMFRGVSIYDISENLIKRETTYMDLATLMVELGVEL